ncbi:MAG: hypothetical protein HQL50_13425 [Magnetococcales bacterium]|nr:hypothetical protein [Magnetococcales bacterium]
MTSSDPKKPCGRKHLKIGSLSITMTLTLAITTLVTLTGGTILVMVMGASHMATQDLIQRTVLTLSSRLESDLRQHMTPMEGHLRDLAQRIDSGEIDLGKQDQVKNRFSETIRSLKSLMGIAASLDGRSFYGLERTPDGTVQTRNFRRNDLGVTHSSMPSALTTSGAAWHEVVLQDGRALIARLQPVTRNGEPYGVLILAISVEELSRMVARIGDDIEGHGFILKGREQVLAHGLRQAAMMGRGLTVRRDTIGDPVLSNLWKNRTPRHIQKFNDKHPGLEVRHIVQNDEHYLAVMRQVPGYGPMPWTVGAWFPAEVLGSDSIMKVMFSGVAGLLVVILAIVAGVFLGRRIAQPIVDATEILSQVRNLDLDAVRPLPQSFFRELNDQANTFNAMLETLRAFGRYVPRTLVSTLMREQGSADSLSEARELAILFTDIGGFTSLSENMEPKEVAEFLNMHFSLLGGCVEAQDGTIDKYIGDALMAFWGAPIHQQDAAERACRAALAIADAWDSHNRDRNSQGLEPIRMRLGVHVGPVVVGNIGFAGRVNYTIVGDAVNACQRLESLGRDVESDSTAVILVSGAVQRQVAACDFSLKPMGSSEVKGRKRPLSVFQLRAQGEER